MTTPVFLPFADILETHRWQAERFGGSKDVRDHRLLEAAIAMPREWHRGEYVHPDLPAMAAAYLYHLCVARAFVTGNRRTALAAALLFLSLNEVEPRFEPNDALAVTDAISSGEVDKRSVVEFFRTGQSPERAAQERFAEAHDRANARFLRDRDDSTAARSLEALLSLRPKVGDVTNDVVSAFHRTVDLFKETGESFVIIGGFATGFRGEPRMTEDIDLLVQLTRKSVTSLATTMQGAGFDIDPNEAGQQWQQLGFTHAFRAGTRIDLMRADDAFHRSVFDRGEWVTLLEQRVRMATVEDCVLMKALAWRLKDVPVAAELIDRHEEHLDREYLEGWADRLASRDEEVPGRIAALLDRALPLPPGRR